MITRKHIIFYGYVQGVGFRWRARNGTVEMEIQGEEEQIDRVIQSIDSGRYVMIERMEVKTIPAEQESGFRTR